MLSIILDVHTFGGGGKCVYICGNSSIGRIRRGTELMQRVFEEHEELGAFQ